MTGGNGGAINLFMPRHTADPARSALHTRTARKLDRLANRVTGRDAEFDSALAREAAPLRAIRDALDAAYRGAPLRHIEEDLGRDLTAAELHAVAEEIALAAAARRAAAEAARAEAEATAAARAEEAAWLAAMAA